MLDALPNEVIITIAKLVPDITSLGRWSQTNHQYSTVLTDNLIWQGLFKRDFPTVSIHLPTPQWRELYRKQVDFQHKFYHEFPEFHQVGEWVMPRFSNGWVDVYHQARVNPILLQPAINRIYHEIKSQILTASVKFATRFPDNPQLEYPIRQRYLLNRGRISLHHGNTDVFSFIITLSAKVPETRERIGRLVQSFSQDNSLICGTSDNIEMLFFDGHLISQSNGALIWFPLARIWSNTRWPDYKPIYFSQINAQYVEDWSKMRVVGFCGKRLKEEGRGKKAAEV
jgi:hypothetical protein